LKRRVLRFGAIIGVTTVSALAIAPAFAAAATSQATARSVNLEIGGNSAISQKITASNDGTSETRNNASTVPTIADLLTGNNVLQAGVAPQDAHANADGTSYACAGLAGDQSGGVVTTGHSSCAIDGADLDLGLGKVNLDLTTLLGTDGSLTGPLHDALAPLLPVLSQLNDAVTQLAAALDNTDLGQIDLAGSLSAIEATCTADPDAAAGDAQIVDTAGGHTIPIRVTIPDGSGGTQRLDLVTLDVNLAPKPGGTDVLVHLDQLSQALIDAISDEITSALGGAIAGLNDPVVKGILQAALQDQIVEPLVTALQPNLLQQLSDNVLTLTVNNRTFGDGGKSVDVTALDVQVLPAAKAYSGSSLVSGQVGHVTCGPNTRETTTGGTTTPSTPDLPQVPTVVDSGVAGHADHTARNVMGATAALMLLAGTAGLVGYRRMLDK
jgi:hypothetical protein